MTACPFCDYSGGRGEVHAHIVEHHGDRVEAWTDAETSRMHYRVECPVCGDDYEHRVKPRSRDKEFLAAFQREIAMVAFDMLLNHIEAAHAEPAAEAEPGTDPRLPAYGPGGGSARPGQHGVPVPPGMDVPQHSPLPGQPRPVIVDPNAPGGAE